MTKCTGNLKLLLFIFSSFLCYAQTLAHPFTYDLHLASLPGKNGRTMLCLHGYGDNYEIASSLKKLGCIEATLVSFNFPEHDIKKGKTYIPSKASFGTIDELLPALYALKQTLQEQHLESIDLYGFSAGGGAVINVIRVLNTSTYDAQLKTIGIEAAEKKRLLSAIQKGIVILDTPLKSVEEIISFRGPTEELELLAKNYRENNLRPIDSLEFLKGLSLNLILHFQEQDEILSNRDDHLYIENLRDCGKVAVIIGNDGGHMADHLLLWQIYNKKANK